VQKVVRRTLEVPLVRRRTYPEASEKNSSAKLRRSRSVSGLTTRVTGSKKEVTNEDSQAQAIKALVVKMSSKKSPEDIIHALCRHVLKLDGTRALPDLLQQLACAALSSADAAAFTAGPPQRGAWAAQEPKQEPKAVGPLAIKVLRDLARRAGLSFADVAGQILWHFRKTDVLSNDIIMHMTAKDLTWVDLAATDMDVKPSALVEKAFQQHANEFGRVDERSFLKMMDRSLRSYIAKDDGVTQFIGSTASFRRTDLDQLFFDQAHGNGNSGLTCNGLKSVLVKLAHNMSVHPAAVFNTMGNWDV